VNIKAIGNNLNNFYDPVKKSGKTQNHAAENVKDKIQISNEAKKLQTNKLNSEDFAKIKERIDSKFYDSNHVLNKVADTIIKEIIK